MTISSQPKASLFLSTYEMPKHLELVLAGVARQSFRDFEVLICDDGSGEETRKIIESFARNSGVPTRHFWQEQKGFRKCRILNEALRNASGEISIFLDGDCVPHRHFIRDHVEKQRAGFYLAGRRMELGPQVSEWLTPQAVSQGFFDWPHPRLIWSTLTNDSEHLQRTVRVETPWLRRALGMERIVDLKGCNYSVPRKILEELNGFDEAYEGYGREDTDMELRLKNYGLRIQSMKGFALQFHVWHPRRAFTPSNDSLLEEVQRTGRVRCERGLHPA
jgi:glycosyltransferase involved in cell wall biosynthesis